MPTGVARLKDRLLSAAVTNLCFSSFPPPDFSQFFVIPRHLTSRRVIFRHGLHTVGQGDVVTTGDRDAHARPTIKLYPARVCVSTHIRAHIVLIAAAAAAAAPATVLLPTAQFSHARVTRLRENYEQDSNEGDTTLYRAVRAHL